MTDEIVVCEEAAVVEQPEPIIFERPLVRAPRIVRERYTRVCAACGREHPACYIFPCYTELRTLCCDAVVIERKNPILAWGWLRE